MTDSSEQIEWMTPAEVAKYLKYPSKEAVRQAVFNGVLPAHKMGRLLRFRKDEIDKLLIESGFHNVSRKDRKKTKNS